MRYASLSLVALVLVSGCATIDHDYPRRESHYLPDTADTYLGREIAPRVADLPQDQSGFLPLNDGIDALAARLLLASQAEKSIDLQYYLIKNDIVSRAFIKSLLDAADRGVRVRLLLDDVFTSGYDVGMAALHAHPNFEIRIFNPFRRGAAGRTLGAMTEFQRINRRMHNKSFTVDNHITIIGGRNIADEYFGAREDSKFSDLDVAAVGPVVQDVTDNFDIYWNHPTALPVPAFIKELEDPEAALNDLREGLEMSIGEIRESRYAGAVRSKILSFDEGNEAVFRRATYQLVVDPPDKGIKGKADESELITAPLVEALRSAQKKVTIVSAYFVPLKKGVSFLNELEARGVEVTVVTNSLAANNQFTVHGGYAPSRKPLLEGGVKIYEVRADADVPGTEFINASGARATLHTKAFLVDDESLFIGSFNFDPRSADINTEMGVIIHDPGMAQEFSERFDSLLSSQTYEVFLNDKGKLRWRGFENGDEVIYDKEPDTTGWQRFKAQLAKIIPKSQL